MQQEFTRNLMPAPEQGQLTQWPNEPSVRSLKEDLAMAEPWHQEHVKKVQKWLDLRNVEGEYKPKNIPNRSRVQPKMVRRQNEWRYAALTEPFLSAEKLFDISGSTWEDKKGAEKNSKVLEWQFRTQVQRVKFLDELVRVTVDEGTCAIRVGWDRQTKIVQREVPVWTYYSEQDPERLQVLQQAMQMMQADPGGFRKLPPELKASAEYTAETGTPVTAEQDGAKIVDEEVITRNRPTYDVIHYENLYIDPSCNGDIEKAKFAVLSFETCYADLKKDGRYKNLEQVNWSSQSPMNQPDHAASFDDSVQFKDQARKRVVAYEYWGQYDVNGDGVLVPIVATWIGDTLVRMEENPFPDQEIPIVLIPYMPIVRSITGEPDAELLEENQAIQGALTRGIIDLMGRSANGQTGFAKGMLDVLNKRRYDSGLDYEYNLVTDPRNGVYHHTYPEIPNSALTMLSIQNQEAEALTGVKAFSGGLSGEAYGDVAAGIRGMLDAAAKREMAITRRIGAGLEKLGRKTLMMNQVFLEEETIVKVTNLPTEPVYEPIRREDLAGEYDLVVDISTPEIDEAKAQDLGFLLQTMGNNMPFEMTQMVLAELAKLKRMPALAHMIENYQPQPDPLEEQMKQAEVRKAMAEAMEVETEAMLNRARAQKEMAMARKAASEADLKDLDFLEQETGTNHAREMDKLGAQAQANQELEITKRLLEPDDPEKKGNKRQDVGQALNYQGLVEMNRPV